MSNQATASNNESAHRFEIETSAGLAHLDYVASGATLDLVHTAVPHALEGKGYGATLARAARKVSSLAVRYSDGTCAHHSGNHFRPAQFQHASAAHTITAA